MFIDTARVEVAAGRGGKGVDSFYRDKYTRGGHPDGGDGGCGGSVIIRVSTDVHTLIDFQYRQHFKGKDGKNGSGKKKKGSDGAGRLIKVPCGTLIFQDATGALLADLTEEGEELIAAKGGAGGRGNRSHKNATEGSVGEKQIIRLELKLIADVGIVGLPNSGKSTLLSKISKARPKIAHYPFTTKMPVLGVVSDEDFEFKIAEVPGLIKDAHKGKGLGDLFLRHIERTKLLVHLIDAGEETKNPFDDYQIIDEELKLYSKQLYKKERILVANKIDLLPAKENIGLLKKKIKQKLLTVSAQTGEGLDILVKEIHHRLKKMGAENAKK